MIKKSELQQCINYWADYLGLKDWILESKLSTVKELKTFFQGMTDMAGIAIYRIDRRAEIHVKKSLDIKYLDYYVLHELLHILFNDYADYAETEMEKKKVSKDVIYEGKILLDEALNRIRNIMLKLDEKRGE